MTLVSYLKLFVYKTFLTLSPFGPAGPGTPAGPGVPWIFLGKNKYMKPIIQTYFKQDKMMVSQQKKN